ncbi:MAG: YbfB/YjiJ family MFS transporter, partial [Burkholderiaceae bacterium]|nr:YbfB/YjiJ family MFS transporter [Burkholderiaceae bacterium]
AWRIIGAATLVLALALSLLMGPEIPPLAAGAAGAAGRSSGRSPIAWRVVIAYGAAGIGYIIPATYLPVMAREIVASPLVFGWSWPMFGSAAFASTLLVARLQDSASNRTIWAISQGVMAIGLLLAAIAPDIVTIIIAGLCVGGTLTIITLIGMKEVHRTVPADDAMRHIAVMTIAFASGQMVGPVFASSLHQATGSFTAPLLAASVVLLLTAWLLTGKTRQY